VGSPTISLATGHEAQVSGLYERSDLSGQFDGGIRRQVVETARLDVDGFYPQMIVSGTYFRFGYLGGTVNWIANQLSETSPGTWEGPIVYRQGDTQVLPHALVRVHVPQQLLGVTRAPMTLTFTGGAPVVSRVLEYRSRYFRTAEFEFDTVETAPRVTGIDTWAHPSRPLHLQREQLDIVETYSRVGVDVQSSPNPNPTVGLEAGVGADHWTDQELHDSMQMFWSRYQPRAQWALWLLFAHYHQDPELLGIMFDNPDRRTPSDTIQRQGAAVFGQRIADKMPAGAYGPAWVKREIFFAAIHEIGHCFNLNHSWQKQSGVNWAFDPGDPNAASFMNYPSRVSNFYDTFEYRFDNPELQFIRHAPEDFVMMGGSPANQDHELRDRFDTDRKALRLEIGLGGRSPVFDFLEPISIELTLTNTSQAPQWIESSLLRELHEVDLRIQPRDSLARRWNPYARYCTFGGTKLLQPGESLSMTHFVSAGSGGWHLAEPGAYTITAALRTMQRVVRAEPRSLRIASPRSRDEEILAQDYFQDEVGRALAFGGTQVMRGAIEALQEIAARLPESAAARHALVTLALPLVRDRKQLRLHEGHSPMSSVSADGGTFRIVSAQPEEASRMLHNALLIDRIAAVKTFGERVHQQHIDSLTYCRNPTNRPSSDQARS
jgi:hypothetical protein